MRHTIVQSVVAGDSEYVVAARESYKDVRTLTYWFECSHTAALAPDVFRYVTFNPAKTMAADGTTERADLIIVCCEACRVRSERLNALIATQGGRLSPVDYEPLPPTESFASVAKSLPWITLEQGVYRISYDE